MLRCCRLPPWPWCICICVGNGIGSGQFGLSKFFALLSIIWNKCRVLFSLRVLCRLFRGLDSLWVLLECTFFWIGSDVLLVFPLFRGNFCRRSQWRGEAIRHNYLRILTWARLISLGIRRLHASTWWTGRWKVVHIRCGPALLGFHVLGMPIFLCMDRFVCALLNMVGFHQVWCRWLVGLAIVLLPLLLL